MNSTLQDFSLTSENPWPGLRSFTEEARDFFFGRADETEALLRLVRRERLTVFYGQSGLGKSSLLGAGLFPKLRPLNLLPVPLRLDYSDQALPPAEQVQQSLQNVFRLNQVKARPAEPGESLWAYFQRKDLEFRDSSNRLVTPVLVFDQFEERFTLGRRNEQVDARAEAFLNELSQLIENRPPPELRARFENDPELALAYNFDQQTCKVIFSLREDFLPELDGLGGLFPSITSNRFRLLPMTKRQALNVVLQPGSNLVSGDVASAIVDFVAFSRQQRSGGEVEPALLSLVLHELNARRQHQGEAQISADLLSGSKDKILEDFYEQAIKDLPAQARLFVEEGLLTSSGYRDSIALEDARSEFGLDDASLASLVNRHLVRREERFGSTRLELVHDLLTGMIARSRDRRQESERQNRELAAMRARQAELEREKELQRRRSRHLLTVCISLIFLCAGLGTVLTRWAYLHRWQHVSYSRGLTKRWGVAEEIGRLTEDMTRHRAASLKFIRKGAAGPLLEVQAITASGQPTYMRGFATYLSQGGNEKDECRWDFVYDEAGHVVYETIYDLRSNLVTGAVHTPTEAGQRTHEVQYFGRDGLPQPQNRGGAEYVRVHYTVDGFEDQVLFQDRHGHPQTGMNMTYGISLSYDSQGRLATSTWLGPDGKPMVGKDGKTTIFRQYDASGNETNEVYLGTNGEPTLTMDGYASVTLKWDNWGNRIEFACFDKQGKPAIDKSVGAHRSRWFYDERGNWTNVIYLGTDGKPTLVLDGYASATARWDDRGNQIEGACFDPQGKPAIDQSVGTHMYRLWYDEHDNLTNMVYLGTNGEPALTLNGYASLTAKWDDRGNRIEWACFDRQGKPAIDLSLGYHMSRAFYDERHNATNSVYLGTNGEPTLTTYGYASQTAEWDDRGNQIEWACFGTNGEPVLCKDGYHLRVDRYDSEGKLISDKQFDVQGNLVIRAKDSRLVVTIGEVIPDGQAAAIGLQKGDVFLEYDDWVFLNYPVSEDIKTVRTELLNRILAKGSTTRRLVVLRNGQLKTFEVGPGRLGVNIVFANQVLPKELLTKPTP